MRLFVTSSTLLLLLGGCFSQHSVQVAPIHVAPIRVTMDVNVNVQDRREDSDPSEEGTARRGDGDAELDEEPTSEARAASDETPRSSPGAAPEDDPSRRRSASRSGSPSL